MAKYIAFEINTLEPVKMGSQGNQYDTEYALSYIAGSTIRGAYINKYINKFGIKDISRDSESRRKLLAGDIKFLNAYPTIKKSRSIPSPFCYYAPKENIKKYNGADGMEVITEFHETKIPEEYEKFRPAEFCGFNIDYENEEYEINSVNVDKIFNLHISKGNGKNNIFRYEALKSGQSFSGIIVVENDNDVKECLDLLNDSIFYLGGSKGSGYGKCHIENLKVYDKNIEYNWFEENQLKNIKGEFYLYAVSDVIYRNSFGEIQNYIDGEYLEEKLGIKRASLVKSSISTQVISGFNNKWRCRLPQIIGIRSGSILKYEFEGELDLVKVKDMVDKGIGDRREEGYGRILLLDDIYIDYIKDLNVRQEGVIPPENLNSNEKIQLKSILTGIYENIVEKEINERVILMNENFKEPQNQKQRLGASQLGKLLQLCVNAQLKDVDEGKKDFKDYLTHIVDKKNNKNVFYRFTDTKLHGESFNNWLERFVNEGDDISKFKTSFFTGRPKLQISGIEPEVTKRYVFNTNMRLFEKFIRFQLRKEEVKENAIEE